jgi:hypothetical protein
MDRKEYIPRVFLFSGTILIFISIFLKWATISHITTGDTTYEYGYDRLEIIILFIFSFVPIIMYEKKVRYTAYYLLVILIELILFTASYRFYLAIYAVKTNIGYYFALIGGLLQLIGILSIIVIERRKKKMRPRPTAPSIRGRASAQERNGVGRSEAPPERTHVVRVSEGCDECEH